MKLLSIASLVLAASLVALFGNNGANGCGMIVHMEASNRAVQYLNRIFRNIDIRELILKNQAAFQTGAVYPDIFYAPLCMGGMFVEFSKITHGMDYIEAALTHFQDNYMYEEPMSEEGEKFLAFVLGNVAHDIQDKVFHGFGIDQGFLSTLSQVNFHGNFSEAHNVADFGGDAVSLFEYNFVNLHLATSQWYVPMSDLIKVYQKIDEDVRPLLLTPAILVCSGLTMTRSLLHKMFIHRYYVAYAMKAPMLISPRFNDYFLGGMNDMASWSMQRIETALRYLEDPSNCMRSSQDDNPLYWTCGDQPHIYPPPESWMPPGEHRKAVVENEVEEQKKNYMVKMFSATEEMVKSGLYGSEEDMIETTEQSGAFYLRPKGALRRALHEATLNELFEYGEMQRETVNNEEKEDYYADLLKDHYRYHVSKAYSSIGQSMVSVDLDKDGDDDLIVGVPGYSEDNRFDEGRVYIVEASQRGVPSENLNLDKSPYSQVIEAPFKGTGRFGYSVVALDFNEDSRLDLAISAPIRSEDVVEKPYSGFVYVYYGQPDGKFKSTPDVTISCNMRYCNFGTFLSTGDVNHDGGKDLIIGSPYASLSFEKNRQTGMVSVFYANRNPKSLYSNYHRADVVVWGLSPYSWFGHSVLSTKSCDLLVGAPGQKTPSGDNDQCNPSLQMSGVVYCYSVLKRSFKTFASSNKEFEFFGAYMTEGYPNGKNADPVLAIGAPHSDNVGKIFKTVPYLLRQSGTVYLYNLNTKAEIAQLIGDRLYGGFGRMLQFVDVDLDSYDDLLVGAPTRTSDLTHILYGEGIGELYLYYGQKDFPKTALNRECDNFFTPCPGKQADGTFSSGLRRAQLGSNAVLLRSTNVTQLVVASQRSDEYARMSGKLLLFNNCLLLA